MVPLKLEPMVVLAGEALVLGLWLAVALAATESLRADERGRDVEVIAAQALKMAKAADAGLATPQP